METTTLRLAPHQLMKMPVDFLANDNALTSAEVASAETQAGVENMKKAGLLDNKLSQMPVLSATSSAPQLLKPAASTGVDETEKLLADVKDIKDLNEFDYDLYQEALKGMDPQSAKEKTAKGVDAVWGFFEYLFDGIKDRFQIDYKNLQDRVTGLVTNFVNDPSPENTMALISAILCLLIDMQTLNEMTHAEIVGMYTELAYASAQFQAESIIDQGDKGMIGGLAQAFSSIAFVAAGVVTQNYGYNKQHAAGLKNNELQLIQNKSTELNKLTEKLKTKHGSDYSAYKRDLADLKSLSAQTQQDLPRIRTELKNEKVKHLDLMAKRKENLDEIAKLEKANGDIRENADQWPHGPLKKERLMVSKSPYEDRYVTQEQSDTFFVNDVKLKSLRAKNDELDVEIAKSTEKIKELKKQKGMPNDIADFRRHTDQKYQSVADLVQQKNQLKATYAGKDQESLETEIRDMNLKAQKQIAAGAGVVQLLGVSQLFQSSLGYLQKVAEADATIDATDANIYKELMSLILQTYAAAGNAKSTLQNALDAAWRNLSETRGVIISNTKMS